MLRLLRTRLAAVRSTGDRGVALAMVVGIASVLLLLISLTMTFSVSGLVRSNHDADWDAAMSAAFAGVADYQGRLTNDPSYQQYGNPASAFTIANGSQNSVALPPSSRDNPAFDVKPVSQGGRWASVPLTDGLPANASFRYEVDNSKYASNGILHLRATGRVDTVTRSVVANIKQTGFTNYVYFTDYEELDPTLNNVNCPRAYAWAQTRSQNCLINFVSGDTFDGQVHSNDTLNICGGTFKQKVTTANPNAVNGKLYTQNNCSGGAGTPTFSSGAPVNAAQITMPPAQAQLDQVRTDIPVKVPSPGCLYTGPTDITFSVSGGTAYMTVISPWTKKTELSNGSATAGTAPAFCGTPGDPTKATNTGTLSDTVNGQKIAIGPASQLYNNLAYVQAVPSDATNANYWSSSASPNNNTFKCVGADGKSAGNGLGYPVVNEIVPSIAKYDCRAGDVFVEGTMHSAMTINAEHFAWITNKLVYQDAANDILGLVGAGAVWVWNPIVCTNPSTYPAADGSSCTSKKAGLTFEASSGSSNCARTINAALLSNDHSFEVHNYDAGIFIGYLCVTGSIAQEFRGPVGQGSGSSGFLKRYSYDTRLLNSPPPKFPTPRTTSYDVNTEIEVKTAFDSTGAPLP
jgi:hypothetical protein